MNDDIYGLAYSIQRLCGMDQYKDPPRFGGTTDALVSLLQRYIKALEDESRQITDDQCSCPLNCQLHQPPNHIGDNHKTVFTDEYLRVLKLMCKSGDWPISGPYLLPLFTRLEAAEQYAWAMDQRNGPIDIKYMDSTREAWRKACGK